MALYAIGDLHLSLSTDKPMDVFGGGWINYAEKIKAGFQKLDCEDICIICGDVSWGMSLSESLKDFLFIDELPGKKIILKGNHDYWWDTATKMRMFFEENGISNIEILHNNCFHYNDVAICGTRGWCTDEQFTKEQNEKIMKREVQRLRTSLHAAGTAESKICFFHYPPRFKNTVCHDIICVMNEFNVEKCVYGHIHGDGHRFALNGLIEGVEYMMVSADYIGFTPQRIL